MMMILMMIVSIEKANLIPKLLTHRQDTHTEHLLSLDPTQVFSEGGVTMMMTTKLFRRGSRSPTKAVGSCGHATEYKLWHEFQSHEAEFDYLKSVRCLVVVLE